jgi:hypothetical protein
MRRRRQNGDDEFVKGIKSHPRGETCKSFGMRTPGKVFLNLFDRRIGKANISASFSFVTSRLYQDQTEL